MQDFYTESFKIEYSEMEQDFALKPYSLLNLLQNIASKNAEDLDFGYSKLSPQNFSWFLIKYRMEFTKYPVKIDNLTIKTRPRGYNKLFAYRDFEIYENDNLLGKIFSMWMIVDLESRRPVPILKALQDNKNMLPFSKLDNDLEFSKIKPLENVSISKDFEVRYNDLDVNGHANNGNYIIWAFEPLDYEFRANNKLKTLDILFKKEARFGENLTSEIEFVDEKMTIHCLKNKENEELCVLECTWV